jgi:hypothetical protein
VDDDHHDEDEVGLRDEVDFDDEDDDLVEDEVREIKN